MPRIDRSLHSLERSGCIPKLNQEVLSTPLKLSPPYNQNHLFDIQADPDAGANFVKVAEVDTDDLEEAFALTNHKEKSWTKNPQVQAEPGSHRSTSVGDVLELRSDRFRIEPFGFKLL